VNLVQAETTIQAYLSQRWTATPVVYPNVLPANFAAPGQPLIPEGDVDYIALRHEFTQAQFITVPARCSRYSGYLYLTVSVRRETGTRALSTHCSELIELFSGQELHLIESAGIATTAHAIMWDTVAGAESYQVEWRAQGALAWLGPINVGNVTALELSALGLSPFEVWEVRVSASVLGVFQAPVLATLVRAAGTPSLQVWSLVGSVEASLDDWYTREIAFSASFEWARQ